MGENKTKIILFFICAISIFALTFSITQAAPDAEITYHGKLTDTSDVPVADGNYDFKFRIYDAVTGGSCVWSARGTCGTPTAKSVSVSKGIFYTNLGESGDNALSLDFNSNYWLEITVGTDSAMSTRRKLTATSHAINSSKLNGQSSSYYLDTSATEQTKSGNLNLSNNLALTGIFKDKDGDAGTSGQILSSTVTGTDWVAAGTSSDEYSEIGLDSSRQIGSPTTVTTLDKAYDYMWSAGLYSGFALTDNGNGTINIADGEGVLRTSASSTAPLHLVKVTGVNNLALTDGATNYIYVDYNSGSPTINTGTSTADFNCLDKCILYRASREGNEIHYVDMMSNNVDANRSYRRKDFEMGSIDIGTGARISETGSRYLSITAGSYWVVLSRLTSPAMDTSVSDTFDLYYRNGSGGWTKTTGNTQINNTQYDDGTGSLATLGTSRWGTRFVFMTVSESSGSHPVVVMGQAEHKSLEEAENEELPGDLPAEIDAVGTPLALVTIGKDSTNFGSILNVSESVFETSLPTTHNNLAGLQGGITSEYFHLSSNQNTNLTGFSDALTLPSVDGANGQALITNGSGTVSWGSVASTFLGLSDTPSSYTAGSVLFTSGSTITEDNTNFFWNDTDNRLGLGQSTPTARAHIKGAGATSATYSLKIDDSADANLFSIRDDGLVSFKNYTFPTADGTANQVLKTNGTGTLTWQNESVPTGDLDFADGDFLVFDKAAGNGIKIDTTTPTFGWRDLLGEIRTRGGGASDPTDATYRGGIKAFQFAANDEFWVDYHIPHDYVPGTDLYLHFHWSTNSASVTGGSVTWGAEVTYAKGHDQAAFIAPVTTTVVGSASTTQYQHMITEVQLSATTPSGSQIDSDDLEPDGVIMIRGYLSANNITGGTINPFLHFGDLHYQSTSISTKGKAPNFYN